MEREAGTSLPAGQVPLVIGVTGHRDLLASEHEEIKERIRAFFLHMQERGLNKLVTYGGAFSNHIAAVAACARHHGMESVGIIRGEELTADANPTLRYAASCGMELIFIDRQSYREKDQPGFHQRFLNSAHEYYVIPEGGSNDLAVRGATEILGTHTRDFDCICIAAGTGGTAAGVIHSARAQQQVLVFPALKGDFIRSDIERLLPDRDKTVTEWSVVEDYHFGGYARWNRQLIDFINDFKAANHIAIDHIYNGKMLFGLLDLIKNGYFSPETSILVIHTGGTQSIVGFNEINGLLIK